MIALLIPTIDRSDFIIKYLTYLKNNQFEGQVLIGDSSNEEHYEKTKNFINNFTCKYEIRQYSHPNLYPHQCIQEMLDDIKYPYSMYICDDDILIVKTLKKCINYLEDNPEYCGVGGVAIVANIPYNDYNSIVSTCRYPVREITGESSVDRVKDLMSNYSVVAYSIYPTEKFKKRWPKDSRNYDKAIGTELLPCAILVAQGKVKMLDDLFVVRQIHDRRIILPTLYDNILQPHWASSTTYAIEYLAQIVAEIDSISYDETYPVVKEAWGNYLTRWTIKKYHNTSKEMTPIWRNPDFRSAVKSIPGAREIVRRLRSLRYIFNARNNDISLPALLNPSSPYHKDFMPVYKAITKQSIIT